MPFATTWSRSSMCSNKDVYLADTKKAAIRPLFFIVDPSRRNMHRGYGNSSTPFFMHIVMAWFSMLRMSSGTVFDDSYMTDHGLYDLMAVSWTLQISLNVSFSNVLSSEPRLWGSMKLSGSFPAWICPY